MPPQKTIKELQEEYDLELDRIIENVSEEKAERVLLQLPDGMKPYSLAIKDYLAKKTGAEFFIWLGSCFGACDLPQASEEDFDLIIQFGHSDWDYSGNENIDVIDS